MPGHSSTVEAGSSAHDQPFGSDRPAPRLAETAKLISLGCKVNQAETRRWAIELSRVGVRLCVAGEAADIVVINTCSVTADADKTSRRLIRQAAQSNPDGLVVVTGCYAAVDPVTISKRLGADLVVPNDDKESLVQALVDLHVVNRPPAADPDAWLHPSERPSWVTLAPALERKARAFVKVQDGCNSFCTYCIVPRARGPQRSRPVSSIVQEVRALYALGYREVVLTGVQIGAYGRDWDPASRRVRPRGPTLTDLVQAVLDDSPMPRVRISSIQPQDWPDGLVELWQDRRMCRHLHLPLQSGSDSVLKRMGRRYRTDQFRHLVSRLRSAVPEVAITADLMVGFSGETDAEHTESLRFVSEMAFAEQHVFRYSARPGTSGSRMPDNVPPELKRTRSQEARQLEAGARDSYRRGFLGRCMDVLWEDPSAADRASWTGLTDNYLRVVAPGAELEGKITRTRLTDLAGSDIRGEIL